MAERNIGRPWSDEEDSRLIAAVKLYGEHDNWKTVALSVPGRTNKACRKRWLHSLSPTVRKTAWNAAEDSRLLELFNRHGAKWSTIARDIPGRTDDACSKRYREALDPNLKKDEWTPDEDNKLITLHAELGGKWGQVGQELQRSGLGCRNRWRLLLRKASKAVFDPPPDHTDLQPFEVTATPLQNEIAHQSHWSVHLPPDAYHGYLQDESPHFDFRLQGLNPEFTSVSPHLAPFQFSSSSLSAALSDPPEPARQLPFIPECTPAMSTSPSPPHLETPGASSTEHQLSQVNLVHSDEYQTEFARLLSKTHFDANGMAYYVEDDDSVFGAPVDKIPDTVCDPWDNIRDDFTRNILDLPVSDSFPFQDLIGLPIDHHMMDDISSTLSTPSCVHPSLSTTSSPAISSPVELPSSDHTTGSLLFSSDHRNQPQRTSYKKAPKKPMKPQGPARLSSMLTLTPDPSVRPYACGREICWPTDAPQSSARFATSKELFDHSKIDHAKDLPGDRPFRCALAGCGKSWKSLNGLQYHLQISTAHFRNALSTSFSSQRTTNGPRRTESTPGMRTDPESADEAKRTYVCHHDQCYKAYRQPSGLRYHLLHGHPEEMPAQLSMVPPALARQMPSKTKKMRRKASTEGDA